jgi:hypothetical protein
VAAGSQVEDIKSTIFAYRRISAGVRDEASGKDGITSHAQHRAAWLYLQTHKQPGSVVAGTD